MGLYLVTVKLARNPEHDPRAKVTTSCPIGHGSPCTDATGEHHTYLTEATDRDTALAHARQRHGHVTRIEHTGHVGSAMNVVAEWAALPHPVKVTLAHIAPELAGALTLMQRADA